MADYSGSMKEPEEAKSGKKRARDDEKILQEAQDRFARIQDDDKDNRDNYREDFHFTYTPGKQWDDETRAKRTQWKESCLEFNQLKQFVHQVVNDQRQNRPGIRVHPGDGKASKEVAEIYQGLIRGIEYQSKAEAVYDNGYQQAVVGNRGWWRIGTEYESPTGFNQRIIIKPISDALTVYGDLDYQEPDGCDRNYVFVTQTVPKKEFERLYPDAEPVSWDTLDSRWMDSDDVLIADYYRRVCKKRTLVTMSDGAVGYKDEMPTPPEGVTIVKERETDTYSVEWYTIGGGQILAEHECPGEYIPVICCPGDEFMIDGKRVYQGLIRHARDPQRMLNYGMTQQAAHLALTPKAPWVATVEQIEGYENIWKNANREAYSVLPYKHVEGVAPPQRTMGSTPDAGWLNWSQQQIGMIKSTIGMYENSLGQRGNEQSGRAIVAREKQGDMSTFHYVDNLSRAIALTGKIIVQWIPVYYDSERIVHTVGIDNTRKMVAINQPSVAPGPDGALQAIKLNDVTTGDYAVTVEAGPGYATKRAESAETLTQLVQAFPPLMQMAGDLVVRAQDIPDADAIADRIKAMLPPQVMQMEQAKEEGGKAPDPRLMQAMAQKDAQLQQVGQAAQQMQQELQQLKSGAQEKLQAAQMDAQIRMRQMEQEAQMAMQKAQADAQAMIDKANIEAQIAIQKAMIEQETAIKKAMIDRMTKLQIAEMQETTKAENAETAAEQAQERMEGTEQ
jgi:hypothetical protein